MKRNIEKREHRKALQRAAEGEPAIILESPQRKKGGGGPGEPQDRKAPPHKKKRK